MGLPTPNLFAGEHNFHSRLEWVSVQDMEKAVEVIVHLCRSGKSAAGRKPARRALTLRNREPRAGSKALVICDYRYFMNTTSLRASL